MRYAPTALEEILAVHVLRMTVGRPRFASLATLAGMLETAGFTDLETHRIYSGYLHPHVLLTAKKKPRAG